MVFEGTEGLLYGRNGQEYGLLYKSQPPYEVLSTRWLGYDDIIRLKGVEEMVEVHYNSGQFRKRSEGAGKGI